MQPTTEPKVFNGSYTITNNRTGEHRTFLIKTQPTDSKFAPGERIAALLSGPDNESDYQAFAFVKDSGVHVWRKKLGIDKPSAFQIYADMLQVLCFQMPSQFGKDWSAYRCEAEKRCLRCNRKLTNPESLKTGYGPECINK